MQHPALAPAAAHTDSVLEVVLGKRGCALFQAAKDESWEQNCCAEESVPSQPLLGVLLRLALPVLFVKLNSRWSSLMKGESSITPKEGILGAPRLLLDVNQHGEVEEDGFQQPSCLCNNVDALSTHHRTQPSFP